MDRFMSSKQKSFEALMTELEELITSVEAGSMPLEKMVEQLEHGTKLVQNCQEKLNALNSRVEMLFKDDGGNGEFKTFDPDNARTRAATGKTPVRKSKHIE